MASLAECLPVRFVPEELPIFCYFRVLCLLAHGFRGFHFFDSSILFPKSRHDRRLTVFPLGGELVSPPDIVGDISICDDFFRVIVHDAAIDVDRQVQLFSSFCKQDMKKDRRSSLRKTIGLWLLASVMPTTSFVYVLFAGNPAIKKPEAQFNSGFRLAITIHLLKTPHL